MNRTRRVPESCKESGGGNLAPVKIVEELILVCEESGGVNLGPVVERMEELILVL